MRSGEVDEGFAKALLLLVSCPPGFHLLCRAVQRDPRGPTRIVSVCVVSNTTSGDTLDYSLHLAR